MKILIISHNPMATQTNMGKTFLSLFSQFGRDELCQLYIYPSFPDVDFCASYYRVTDKDVLKSYFGRTKVGGEVSPKAINSAQGQYENEEDRSLYRNPKNKSAVRRLMRDAMWKFSPWYGSVLKKWLDQENPNCIFVAPGVAKFVYNIALKISKECGIPIVTYICDEYYFVRKPSQWLDRLRLALLRRKIEQLMVCTRHLVVISEELKEAYASKFGVDATTLMTGAACLSEKRLEPTKNPTNICYFGNIRCNRFVSLGEIGRELESINEEKGTDYKLKIYTAEKDPQILAQLEGISAVELCGFVSGAAYQQAFAEAHLLLHTEAFDEASIDFTQHSISTKIAESLASGIPLLAYCPDSLSSMKHLLRHKCSLTATSKEELRSMLLTALENPKAREIVTTQAIKVAEQMHDSRRNSEMLRQILMDISKR